MAICEAYKNRENKVMYIAAKFRISRGDVARIAVEMGAEPRSAKKYGKKLKQDNRTNRERLIERTERALEEISLLPSSVQDDIQLLLLEILNELQA